MQYLPCDNHKQCEEDPNFLSCIAELDEFIARSKCDHLIVGGDMNVDLSRNNAHSKCLSEFASRHNLLFAWKHANAKENAIYVNETLSHYSCIDYFMIDKIFYDEIENHVVDDIVLPTGHRPIKLSFRLNISKLKNIERQHFIKRLAWYKASEDDIDSYRLEVKTYLDAIEIPFTAVKCNSNAICNDGSHNNALANYASSIIDACLTASNKHIPFVKKKKDLICGWNKYIKDKRKDAIFWMKLWRDCGKLNHGVVYDIMRKTRREYHQAIKQLKRDHNNIQNERLADAMLNNMTRDFWTEIKKKTVH